MLKDFSKIMSVLAANYPSLTPPFDYSLGMNEESGDYELVVWTSQISKPDLLTLMSTPAAQKTYNKVKADEIRLIREDKISALQWRYECHAREVRLGNTPTDDILVIDKYIQELADITKQPGFPDNVVWPISTFPETDELVPIPAP